MDQAESNMLDEVLAQLKFQVIPALKDIKDTADKQEEHLDKLNGTVAVCLRHDAVLTTKLETLESKTNETANKQTTTEEKITRTIITLGSLIIIALVAAILDLLSKVRI
jgi:hypothetical protein